MGAGILPVTFYKGILYILLGQERHNPSLWSDFGGSSNTGEDRLDTATREGEEELNGFLGNKEELKNFIKNNPIMAISSPEAKYTTFLLKIKYNEELPYYFRKNSEFVKKYNPELIKKNNGLYEKKRIAWFAVHEKYISCKDYPNFEIRTHYKQIIHSVIHNKNYIITQIRDNKNFIEKS
tara:strand:- start:4461 stop:5000 length:540 start_codon:yes stop_codon:yes gene_type:complete